MNIIVNVDKNWAIGLKNSLLVHIPADMRFFKEMTEHKVVVMGRKTLESFPGGQPLKNRVNIVITKKADYNAKGAVVVHSAEEALDYVREYQSEDVFVIGGETIYKQMLPYCDTAYITKTDFAYEADTYFPNLDQMENWKLTEESEEQTYYDLEYRFCRYENLMARIK